MSANCAIISGVNDIFQEKDFSDITDAEIREMIKNLEDSKDIAKAQVLSQLKILEFMENYAKDVDGNPIPLALSSNNGILGHVNTSRAEAALIALISPDINEVSNNISAQKRMEVIQSKAFREINEFMDAMMPTKIGLFKAIFSNKTLNPEQAKLLNEVIKAMFKDPNVTNPDAIEFANALGKALDNLHQQHSARTGKISTLKDYGLPTKHDALKVRSVSKEAWMHDVLQWLNTAQMLQDNPDLDWATLKQRIEATYEVIRSDGINKFDKFISPTTSGADLKVNRLRNEHGDHRFLKFKDGDSWAKYQAKYGSGSVYQTITDHVLGMSREIALMEKFGPDYDQGFAYAKTQAMRLAEKERGDSKESAIGVGKRAQSYFDQLKGIQGMHPTKVASFLSSARNYMVSVSMGTSVLPAQTDHAFAANRAILNNMDPIRYAKKYASMLADKENRAFANSLISVADMAVDRVSSSFENMDAMYTGRSKAMADLTMRTSGMSIHTQSSRNAFNSEFIHTLTDFIGKHDWDSIPKGMKDALNRYGINDLDWEVLRNAQLVNHRGVDYIDIAKLTTGHQKIVQDKLIGMILTEMDHAVPTPGAREKAVASFGTDAGTIVGELVRTQNQFLSFPITLTMQYFGKMIYGSGTKMDKVKYMAGAATMSTVLGALIMQAQSAVQGKGPEDMDTADFWMRAMDKGGSFGVIGSFILNTEGYYAGISNGPVFDGPVKDLAYNLVAGNLQAMKNGDDTNFSGDAYNFIRNNVPGKTLWQTRLIVDRAIWDQLGESVDPHWRENQRAKVRRMREKGQTYYLAPGDLPLE